MTDGGRVLCVVGAAGNVSVARDAAYAGVHEITWDGAFTAPASPTAPSSAGGTFANDSEPVPADASA